VRGRTDAPSAVEAFGSAFAEMAHRDDWAETAWVLSESSGLVPNGPATMVDYRERSNGASFQVSSSTASRVLIVTSLVQDGGWSARGNSDRALEVTRANGPFLAVWITPGTTAVDLFYNPPGFRAGLAISIAAAVGIAISLAALGKETNR
jgi:uncharacterized membrane protein YfhO